MSGTGVITIVVIVGANMHGYENNICRTREGQGKHNHDDGARTYRAYSARLEDS